MMMSMDIISTQEILNDFLNQEESHNTWNYNQVINNLLRIMRMAMAFIIVVIMMIMRMVFSRRAQVRKCMEENVSEQTTNCESNQIVNYWFS